MTLPSRIPYRPLRYLVGALISLLILVAAPLLAFIVLAWNHLWWDAVKLGKALWLYLVMWVTVTGHIWLGVFTQNRWFSEEKQD